MNAIRANVLAGALFALANVQLAAAAMKEGSTSVERAGASALAELPEPDRTAIFSIREPAQWTNPWVQVNAGPDGYTLVCMADRRLDQHMSLAAFEAELLSLSPDKWLLGRIVVVQTSGPTSGGIYPDRRSNADALIQMLESHQIRINRWPL